MPPNTPTPSAAKRMMCAICLPILFSGCIQYSTGKTTGYVYAIDRTIFGITNSIYIKSSLESSETDCYLADDEETVRLLEEAMENKKSITMKYTREIFRVFGCNKQEVIVNVQ